MINEVLGRANYDFKCALKGNSNVRADDARGEKVFRAREARTDIRSNVRKELRARKKPFTARIQITKTKPMKEEVKAG